MTLLEHDNEKNKRRHVAADDVTASAKLSD